MPCQFDWRHLYEEQLYSFAGNRATVVEIVGNQPASVEFCAEEIARRGLNESVRYFPILDAHSEWAAKQFKPGEVSFAFIDGAHTYERTMANLRAYYPLVHFNSAIAGHGIRISEVRRAVEEFAAEKKVKWRMINECWQINHCHTPNQIQ